MKKLIALVLSLALLLSCCAALAEAGEKTEIGSINLNGAFKLQCTLPEDYEIHIANKDNEGLIALINSEDQTKPVMYLVIEFDETYYDVKRMNDMSEEQIQTIIDTFTNDGDEMDFSFMETAHGTKLLVAKDKVEGVDIVAFLTIYEGYMIEFDMSTGFEATEPLTEEQIQMCVDFLSDLDFIPEEE